MLGAHAAKTSCTAALTLNLLTTGEEAGCTPSWTRATSAAATPSPSPASLATASWGTGASSATNTSAQSASCSAARSPPRTMPVQRCHVGAGGHGWPHAHALARLDLCRQFSFGPLRPRPPHCRPCIRAPPSRAGPAGARASCPGNNPPVMLAPMLRRFVLKLTLHAALRTVDGHSRVAPSVAAAPSAQASEGSSLRFHPPPCNVNSGLATSLASGGRQTGLLRAVPGASERRSSPLP